MPLMFYFIEPVSHSGHDHTSNSKLYKLDPATGLLIWVGDARTASLAADNWEPDETAEKFHTRPTYYDGRIYVATLDKSTMDDTFRTTRGFHWYAYQLDSGEFIDLSAAEPNGVGAEQLQIVSIQADPVNHRIYGITIPENQLLYYDIASFSMNDQQNVFLIGLNPKEIRTANQTKQNKHPPDPKDFNRIQHIIDFNPDPKGFNRIQRPLDFNPDPKGFSRIQYPLDCNPPQKNKPSGEPNNGKNRINELARSPNRRRASTPLMGNR